MVTDRNGRVTLIDLTRLATDGQRTAPLTTFARQIANGGGRDALAGKSSLPADCRGKLTLVECSCF
jgi:hypothetical protein